MGKFRTADQENSFDPVSDNMIELADCFFVTGANPAWCHPIIWRRVEAHKAANPHVKIIFENVCFDGNKFTYETFGGSTNESTTAYASETKAGTYKLKGHIITLTFNNGIVENKLFFFMPDSKEMFGIGSTYYLEK